MRERFAFAESSALTTASPIDGRSGPFSPSLNAGYVTVMRAVGIGADKRYLTGRRMSTAER